MITMTLPIEPVAKGRPRLGQYGVFTPLKTRHFERDLRQLMNLAYRYKKPLTGPIYLVIRFILKRPAKPKHKLHPISRPDMDNFLKGIMDAANGILWVDDSQVVHTDARKLYDVSGAGPRIELAFREIEE